MKEKGAEGNPSDLDKIYKANFVLRAIYLTPGAHTIRFAFDPFSFKLGLSISLATLLFGIFYIS